MRRRACYNVPDQLWCDNVETALIEDRITEAECRMGEESQRHGRRARMATGRGVK